MFGSFYFVGLLMLDFFFWGVLSEGFGPLVTEDTLPEVDDGPEGLDKPKPFLFKLNGLNFLF